MPRRYHVEQTSQEKSSCHLPDRCSSCCMLRSDVHTHFIRRQQLHVVQRRPSQARERKVYGVTTANLASVFESIGTELQANVAPAGSAFARAALEKPELVLCTQDGRPTIAGTYVTACVLYQTIFGISPVGNAYSGKLVSDETRSFLRRIAAENFGTR